MPVPVPVVPASPITPRKDAIINEYEASGSFGKISVEFKFPKPNITSKMISIQEQDALLISCLSKNPLSLYKDHKLLNPTFEKNPMLPMKPIQRLQSMAEYKGVLVLGHGERCLEFTNLCINDTVRIYRNHQQTSPISYSKLQFNENGILIGIGGNQLDFWDTQKHTRLGTMVAKGTISDFDFCRQSPSIGAFCNGSLHLVDFRESFTSPALLQKQSLSSTILKWNPHVPYWIAAANTSALEILDIRYHGRLPLLQIPHAGISQMSWSESNCDLILAASKDRRINLWALGQDTSVCRLNTVSLSYELESLCPASAAPNFFYGLDANDTLINVQLSKEYLSKIAPLQSDDPQFKELEQVLYTRDTAAVQQKLMEACKAETSSLCFRQVKQLILLSMSQHQQPLQPLDLQSIGSLSPTDSGAAFQKLLFDHISHTQRTFIRSQGEPGSQLQVLFDRLRLKIRASELIAADDSQSLLKFTKLLSVALQKDPDLLTQSQIIKLCALLLKSSRQEALEFIASLPSQPILLWLAHFPTIFDARSFECLRGKRSLLSRSIDDLTQECQQESEASACERLRNELFDALIKEPNIDSQMQKVIQQLTFTGVNLPESDESLQEAILSEASQVLQSIVCVEPVKRLLESLLQDDRSLCDFFAVAFRLLLLTAKTPFHSGLSEFISGVGFTRLKTLLRRALAKPFTCGPGAIRSLLTIIGDPFCAFGVEQMTVLVELFGQISGQLEGGCDELARFYKSSPVVQQILMRPSRYPSLLLSEIMKRKQFQ